MIRAVLDTNIIISGMLWAGTPSLVLQAASQNQFRPLISETMLDELKDVLERPKFSGRLALAGKTAAQIVEHYLTWAEIVSVHSVERIIHDDADDDEVLACALNGRAIYIVSGDPHLLTVKQYEHISILTASDFLILIEQSFDQG